MPSKSKDVSALCGGDCSSGHTRRRIGARTIRDAEPARTRSIFDGSLDIAIRSALAAASDAFRPS
jgi:hypothetical protein